MLAWIDTNHPDAELHVRSVVSWIYDGGATPGAGRGEDPFFGTMGRALVTCLLAHLVWSDPETAWRPWPPGLRCHAEPLGRHPRHEPQPDGAAHCRHLDEMPGRGNKGIEWLFTGAYADLLSVGTFDPHALLVSRTTVFLNIGLPIWRMAGPAAGVLFLLDEAARLGRLKALETARDIGGKIRCLAASPLAVGRQMAEA